MVELFANSGDPDQMQCSLVSDLGLHCLPITLKVVSRLQWFKLWVHVVFGKKYVFHVIMNIPINKQVNKLKRNGPAYPMLSTIADIATCGMLMSTNNLTTC